MNNLFDMMMQAQNGNAVETLARQFGLSRDQTQWAIELMMPAFSRGLKQNTADPMGLMNFMTALSSGRHGKYHDDPHEAFREEAIAEGNAILSHLFGSKNISRAVADQVALASGIGPAILKQMLPVVADIVMGGLFKGSMSGAGRNGGAMGDLLAEMMKAMTRAGMAAWPSSQKPASNPMQDNPFGRMMEDFWRGAMPDKATTAPPSEELKDTPKSGEQIFGDMFEAGRNFQEEYKKSVDNIFERYLEGMRKL